MSENQQAQQDMLKEAQEQPGVAEAVEVFSRLQRYTHQPIHSEKVGAFATGGNQ